MIDNLVLKKIWQDNELIELQATCSSPIITVITKIYVSCELIDDLANQINLFVNGHIEEAFWSNGERGDDSTSCLSFHFLKKDKVGHLLIEVFAELDDGGNYSIHNCCFFINTEHSLLIDFCKKLPCLKDSVIDFEVQLNEF